MSPMLMCDAVLLRSGMHRILSLNRPLKEQNRRG
jgi:hypothetical protein